MADFDTTAEPSVSGDENLIQAPSGVLSVSSEPAKDSSNVNEDKSNHVRICGRY